MDLSFSEQLLRVFFSTFRGQKILATALKSYIKWLSYIFFSFEKVEKIGFHSNFNFECNTESGSKESLSMALGMYLSKKRLAKKTHFSNCENPHLIDVRGRISKTPHSYRECYKRKCYILILTE